MQRYSSRIGMVAGLVGLVLLAPAAGWGACSDEAQQYYEQGTKISQKYTAQGRPCLEECLGERLYFYKRAVELCASHAEAHNNLGDALEKLGRYSEAHVHYTRAIELQPGLADAYFGLGDLYFNTGEYARAVETYDQGLKLASKDKLAQKLRALAFSLKDKNMPDAETIQAALGGEEFKTLGPAGVRPHRRLPISIPFADNDDKLLPEAKRPLHELGTALKGILSTPSAAFLIEGHTDLRGTAPYNLDLSERRGRRVAEYLVEVFQIPPDRLGIKGYGKTRPRSPGSSTVDHARNRRVEVVRLEVNELAAYPALRLVRGALPQASTPLAVDVGVFYEDPESRPRKLGEGAVLRSGDGYRIYFEPHQSCYVYIFQVDGSGTLFRLYPNPDYGTRDNFAQARTAYWVPKDEWFALDNTRGEEVLYVVATTERREDIEDLFTRYARSEQPDTKQKTQQELTVVLKTMGVERVRPGKTVPVASMQGRTAELTTDQLLREGVSFTHRFAFRHE